MEYGIRHFGGVHGLEKSLKFIGFTHTYFGWESGSTQWVLEFKVRIAQSERQGLELFRVLDPVIKMSLVNKLGLTS